MAADYDQVREVLATEWCAILDTAAVDDDDDFFALGGNSLMAVNLVERVERQLDVKFPLQSLFLDGSFGGVVAACYAETGA
jgi:acyl carrier protein